MSEYGIKIKNIKAGTLYGYNLGLRDRYDYTSAMLNNSLFSMFLMKNGLDVYKNESTRDVICFDFDFGSRSFEEEMKHLKDLYGKCDAKSKEKVLEIIRKVNNNKDKYVKKTKEEIREEFYQDSVTVKYETCDKEGKIKNSKIIKYNMLYRTPSKAKVGQVMFINENLYDIAYDWLTMGLGNKMPSDNAKIVELSAYAPLTTSTIIDSIHIPLESILILDDKDSLFKTVAKIVKAEDYELPYRTLDEKNTEKNILEAKLNNHYTKKGRLIYKKVYIDEKKIEKKCIVTDEEVILKNTIWDGMGLIESSFVKDDINGMILLRNHFFKMCGFKSNIQLFFKDWCEKTGKDYDTYEVLDRFKISHKLKDIKVITTDNAIKWKKFKDFMGDTELNAYQYWADRINADGAIFGIVKTDHESKFGDVQQMSYQMINTLPCEKDDIREIAKTSVEYVESIKKDNDEFEKFLRKNANEINHYEMLADLYKHNTAFANSKWFRTEKSKIILNYIGRLRKGKITINADNLTICGNPYALLLYSVGEDYQKDPTLNYEERTIQCYTTRFDNDEYLCAIRNPHNSPNNICYLHNNHSDIMKKYFPFSKNIIAVNCIKSDIQDRANGMDEDSDFFFVTNQPTMVKYAQICYNEYPTIVNQLKESNITYKNTKLAYAEMDNRFAKSRMSIGESSNLAQLAMTYYWTNPYNKDLYDNFIILSVLAQVAIDSCKREYEVNPILEIERIKAMNCMKITHDVLTEKGNIKKVKCDLPKFMKYTKEIKYTKNGKEIPYIEIKERKEKSERRINDTLICPMNWLEEILDEIQGISKTDTTPTKDFFIKKEGRGNPYQMSKILKLVEEYDNFVKNNHDREDEETYYNELLEMYNEILNILAKMKIGNIVTYNRLIETALGLEKQNNSFKENKSIKYTRKLLNILYKTNKKKFLSNFNAEITQDI